MFNKFEGMLSHRNDLSRSQIELNETSSEDDRYTNPNTSEQKALQEKDLEHLKLEKKSFECRLSELSKTLPAIQAQLTEKENKFFETGKKLVQSVEKLHLVEKEKNEQTADVSRIKKLYEESKLEFKNAQKAVTDFRSMEIEFCDKILSLNDEQLQIQLQESERRSSIESLPETCSDNKFIPLSANSSDIREDFKTDSLSSLARYYPDEMNADELESFRLVMLEKLELERNGNLFSKRDWFELNLLCLVSDGTLCIRNQKLILNRMCSMIMNAENYFQRQDYRYPYRNQGLQNYRYKSSSYKYTSNKKRSPSYQQQ